MGDFNYPDINWRLDTSPPDMRNPATRFLETLRDAYLNQHVMLRKYHGGTQNLNIQDLIITNEEAMISQMVLSAPVGKGHHVCINFIFNCYTPEQPSQKPKYIYHKWDYDAIRHEAEKLNWYSNDDLETSWNHFKYNILNLMDKHIPKTKQNQRNKKKRPNYMMKKL